MGIIIDYFAVRAEDALPALSSVGGPGGPGSSVSTVASVGIQPVPDLEGMVSRLPTADGDGEIEILGESNGYEQVLIGIPESWQSALNDATEPQLRAAAVEFRHAAENMVHGAPDVLTTDDGLADGLVALAQLAQTATAAGLRMFCWISM